ncbi:hypothetical protein RND81_11G220100 [Saponaria officinalis]|uniref:Uncharacterized protein n=1 Tax=Saponaria officinalis TaxID=3572 RepID=A0AAW1HPA9_SAPOF
MAYNKLVIICVILAIIFEQETKLVNGRQLRSQNINGILQFNTRKLEDSKAIKDHKITHAGQTKGAGYRKQLQVAVPVQRTSDIQSPPTPPPSSGHLDTFRPTAPGTSPGAGHSIHN